MTCQTNAAGETVTTSYHFLRPTRRHYSQYPQNDVIYTYNAAGQVSYIQDGNGEQTFSYDELGNVSENVRTFAMPFSHNTYTFTMDYEYDSWGRLLAMTYPDGERVRYHYDAGGSLLSVVGMKNGITQNIFNLILEQVNGYDKREFQAAYRVNVIREQMGNNNYRTKYYSSPNIADKKTFYKPSWYTLRTTDKTQRIVYDIPND